jgi:hypothetical protein
MSWIFDPLPTLPGGIIKTIKTSSSCGRIAP